jgi:membrane associated rhomboid family serine protease
VFVGFFYGSVLVTGIIPRIGSQISWDGHLCGAIAGGVVAIALARGSHRPSADARLNSSV